MPIGNQPGHRPPEQDLVFKEEVEKKRPNLKERLARLFAKKEPTQVLVDPDFRKYTPDEVAARQAQERQRQAQEASERATKERLQKEARERQQLQATRDRIAARQEKPSQTSEILENPSED